MAEPIWIEGRVEGAGAVVVDVTLSWDGATDKPTTRARQPFVVITEAGERIDVELEADAVITPTRTERGPWGELQLHATRPHAGKSLHPDGHVALAGTWVLGGERVAVLGHATGGRFVEGTGGPREAPEQRVGAIRAIGIGVGPDARADVEAERARRVHAAARRNASRSAVGWLSQPRNAAIVFAIVAAAVVPLGLYGLAMCSFHLATVWAWAAAPVGEFPGGASDKDDVNRARMIASLNTFVAPMIVGIAFGFGAITRGSALRMGDAMIGGMLAFVLVMELGAVVRALVARPRAEAGFQLELPTRGALRALLVVILLGLAVGSIAWIGVNGDFSADEPMT